MKKQNIKCVIAFLAMACIFILNMNFIVFPNELQTEYPEIPRTQYIPVLMYHHFVEGEFEAGNGATMSIDEFDEQIKYFSEQGYKFIFLDELYDMLYNARMEEAEYGKVKDVNFDDKYICITIDDGYRSNYELAFDVLKKYNAKANISVITSRIHINYINSDEIPKMKWDDLNEMQESGLVKIYDHTYGHVEATNTCTSNIVRYSKKSEELLNKKLNERGIKVYTYPSGRYTYITQMLLRKEGYDLQLSTDYGIVNKDTPIYNIPRVTVDSGMTPEDIEILIEGAVKKTFYPEPNIN